MDLGAYERFLDKNLSKLNYVTGGKIFNTVLTKERKGEYLGRDVQFIPHVTGEIKAFVRECANATKADVVIIEVGGTVGDLENGYFMEAMRQLQYEEGRANVIFSNVTYAFNPSSLGEFNSKPAQSGIRTLMSLGIQPEIVVVRAAREVGEKVREKISIYSNVPLERVVCVPDASSIYEVPIMLHEKGLDKVVLELLGIKKAPAVRTEAAMRRWEDFCEALAKPTKSIKIGITGKYTEVKDSYASIMQAIEHSRAKAGCKVELLWIETSKLSQKSSDADVAKVLDGVDGIIVPGGFGSRGTEGKIKCIEFARKNSLPYLGLCYGMQMAVIEFCRNVLDLSKANSTEIDSETCDPVIDILPEQKKIEGLGGNMRLGGKDVELTKGSIAAELYGKQKIRERFRHRYEVNPAYIERIQTAGMVFSGKAPKHPIMQVLEIPSHPFFVGTQFHPELTSRPFTPNPLFLGFVKACLGHAKKV
jgi:CTP synthase